MRGVVVEIAGPRFGIPFECPCCGATPPTAEIRIGTPPVLFPYCTRCLAHVRRHDAARVASALAMLLTLGATVVAAVMGGPIAAIVAFVAGASCAWWVRTSRRNAATAMRGASCAATEIAVAQHDLHAYAFESPTFAARFAEENKTSLANVTPQLQRLIDGYQRARLAVPTPAVATGVAPPPLTHQDWLARLESTDGILARRVQLQRALDMTEEAHRRRELIQTVARIELASVLTKVPRMPSVNAKKQLLEDTIARVRLDNIPEDLQSVEVQELQARLDEL